VFTKRIFFGVVMTWTLLEGAKGIWRLWAMQNSGAAGIRGTVAADIGQVTG
jgi:hypothetical protein